MRKDATIKEFIQDRDSILNMICGNISTHGQDINKPTTFMLCIRHERNKKEGSIECFRKIILQQTPFNDYLNKKIIDSILKFEEKYQTEVCSVNVSCVIDSTLERKFIMKNLNINTKYPDDMGLNDMIGFVDAGTVKYIDLYTSKKDLKED